MNKFAVKIFPIIISILLIFSFSCSNKSGNDKSEINKLEYHGFIFHEGKVSVFLKNYSKENYLITLNSLSPEEEIKEKELIEKTLTQKENKDINISVGKRGSKLKVITQAINNAKDSLNRKLYESQNNKNLFE